MRRFESRSFHCEIQLFIFLKHLLRSDSLKQYIGIFHSFYLFNLLASNVHKRNKNPSDHNSRIKKKKTTNISTFRSLKSTEMTLNLFEFEIAILLVVFSLFALRFDSVHLTKATQSIFDMFPYLMCFDFSNQNRQTTQRSLKSRQRSKSHKKKKLIYYLI